MNFPLSALTTTLDQLPVGTTAVIIAVAGHAALRRRILELGLTPGTSVTVCKVAPWGDPMEILVRDYRLSLRSEEGRIIAVAPTS